MGSLIGIDEVGRGCWAGPLLVVAARAKRVLPVGLADSKVLSKKVREGLIESIVETCELGEGWVQPEEIDKVGLAEAMRIGVSRALIALGASFNDEIILDGPTNYCPKEFNAARAVVRADSTYDVVSAASIYAKVKRDAHMARVAIFYPFYGFESHVGYGTELHRITLKTHGVSRIHRKSYKPVRAFL
ncbi:ribonuclease HII [Candidatus Saccharibacteria bacterium]|nr:ribonuclease HII [Candidatus Saccharibacteria bacterium]MBI3338115.1 ribonuclease HII [Candidatus Saccharibacteria bacterium]